MQKKKICFPNELYPAPTPGLRPQFSLTRHQLHLMPNTPDLTGTFRCRPRNGHQQIAWDLKLCAFAAIVRPDVPDQPLDRLSQDIFDLAKELTALLSQPADGRPESEIDAAWTQASLALAMRGERRIYATDRPFDSARGLGTLILAIAPSSYEFCDITVTA